MWNNLIDCNNKCIADLDTTNSDESFAELVQHSVFFFCTEENANTLTHLKAKRKADFHRCERSKHVIVPIGNALLNYHTETKT